MDVILLQVMILLYFNFTCSGLEFNPHRLCLHIFVSLLNEIKTTVYKDFKCKGAKAKSLVYHTHDYLNEIHSSKKNRKARSQAIGFAGQ